MIPDSLPLVYFGKLPARGDFVRARAHISETNAIDEWVSQALAVSESIFSESLVDKENSNNIAFLNFSHIDTRSNEIITGVLIPSHDSSHRNYPLIGFGVIHLDKPKNWMKYLPVKSAALWDDTYEILSMAKSKTDNADLMEYLNDSQLTINNNASTHYYDFINTTTLHDIAVLMNIDKSQLIQQVIATGLLFLPTFTKGFNGLNKAICWSLTSDRESSIHMATFWHDLINGFYQPHQLSLNTYLYRVANCYRLLLSFNKPDGRILEQISESEKTYPEDWVVIANSDWTKGYIDEDIGLTRFNKVLLQDNLYLYDTRQLFKKTFLAQ
ncbi:type VI secretion system-associated protein TagF [Psychrobacter sp. FME5]|uniref:type VI secretion system-associated protein TagF n=1 Tax=Psychrobacter sp. FME5 TaxID=2487706 RepID=UPI0017889886|nr:type VI secretion system-associated protein TagF [Psychrobacter sp. FME5]MBE0444521.1 type VI secretion system-associated protein TagF [Psychrobacter sp. FME5]MDN5801563.1 type VI secretion system-associated protein TagF [Psychrobacter sp.]MDN5890964.1 type VI secretion system-associated protein TagF [Psychrobacter sp.]